MLTQYKILAALTLAGLTFAGGFLSGKKWERAELVNDYGAALTSLSEKADALISEQDVRWRSAIDEVRSGFDEWTAQNVLDEALILQLIEGQDALRRDFREMENEIVVTDLGTCTLSPDAVRLLREAAARANAARNPGPSD